MLVDFYRIECFLTAAELGNMTKAAEKMSITQPAMSFQIRELERELQFSLFERDYNGIRLTEPGKLMQKGFIHIMDSYRRLLDSAISCAYGKVRLSIGYHGFINWAGIHSFIADFSNKHPDIEVSIISNQWKELADYLELGTLDVAFIEKSELSHRPQLTALSLFQEKTCFAVSPSNPLAAKQSVTKEDLKNETILMNNHPSDAMNEMINRLLQSGLRKEQMRFVDQPDIALAMSVAEQGLTSLPISFQQENIPLKYIEYDTPICHMSYSLAWNHNTTNPAVKLFCGEVSRTLWPYRR